MLSMNGQLPDRLIVLPRSPSFTEPQTEQAGLLSPRLRSFSGRSSGRCDDPLLTWRTASQSGGDVSSGLPSPPASPGNSVVSPTHEMVGTRTLFKGRKSLVSGAAEGGSLLAGGGGSGLWDLPPIEASGADEDVAGSARESGGSSGRAEPDLLSGLVRRNSYSVAQMATMRTGAQQPNGRLSAAGGEHQYRNPPSLLGGSPRSSAAGTEILGRSSSFLGVGNGSSSSQGGGSLLVGLGRSHTLASSSRDGTAIFGDGNGVSGEDGEGMKRQGSFTGRQSSFSGLVRPTWRGGAVSSGDHLQSQTHEALQRLMLSSSSAGGAFRGLSEGDGGGGSLSVCAGSGGSFSSSSGSGLGRASSGVLTSSVSAAGVGGMGSGSQRKFSAKGVLGSVVDKGLGLFRSGSLSTTNTGLASSRGHGKLDVRVGAAGGVGGFISSEDVSGDRNSDPSLDSDGHEPEAGEVVVAEESY